MTQPFNENSNDKDSANQLRGSAEIEATLKLQDILKANEDLTAKNIALEKACNEAVEAKKIQSEFLANMSHEIRTPLNGILGMTQILLSGDLNPEAREHVTLVSDAGQELLNLINDIPDFSKIESEKLAQVNASGISPSHVMPVNTIKRPELILLVEDHPINQKVALLLLNQLKFEAHVAENGRVGLELLSRVPYDLVLMDVLMPEMSGLEATAAIRKMELATGQHLPIIAMTAHAIEGSREACIEAGMDDYLSKPIDPAKLKLLLNTWLPQRSIKHALDLAKLKTQFGEQSKQLISLFLNETPSEISHLKRCVSDGNLDGLIRSAHTLKGVCGSLTADGMRQKCIEVETAAKNKDWPTILDLLDMLDRSFLEVRQYLTETESVID